MCSERRHPERSRGTRAGGGAPPVPPDPSTTLGMTALLCVFAHQDDEYGVAARITRERKSGRRVICAYLTDGAASVPSYIRNDESRGVLTTIGVDESDILFLGSEHDIPDGSLVEHLEAAFHILDHAVRDRDIDEVL